jgi:hypothetical protein
MCLQIILALRRFKEEINSAIIKKIQQSTCPKKPNLCNNVISNFFSTKDPFKKGCAT